MTCTVSRVSVRHVSVHRGGDVSDVDPGPGHSGSVYPPPESLSLPVFPSQRPARPLVLPGSGGRLLLPTGRPPLRPGRTKHRE